MGFNQIPDYILSDSLTFNKDNKHNNQSEDMVRGVGFGLHL